jgi:hypothetical protein
VSQPQTAAQTTVEEQIVKSRHRVHDLEDFYRVGLVPLDLLSYEEQELNDATR